MTARLSAWLSALLLFSAVFGTPVARVSTYRASTAYVYSYCEERREPAEEVAVAVERRRPDTPAYLVSAPAERAAGAILGFSLFQRPPPSLSL